MKKMLYLAAVFMFVGNVNTFSAGTKSSKNKSSTVQKRTLSEPEKLALDFLNRICWY